MGLDSPPLLDGYTTVQALRQGRGPAREFRPRTSPRRPPGFNANNKPDRDRPAQPTHATHTVMPARFDIICYDCGYSYSMQGRIYKALCPKCKKFLEAGDVTIDADWHVDVRTIGVLTVQPAGVAHDAELVATDIVLAGDARKATLRAMRRLEIQPGGLFDIGRTRLQDLTVHAGVVFDPRGPLTCRNVDIAGTLSARLRVSGTVTIRAAGVLKGEVCGAHLIVEEGGGLLARVDIRRESAANNAPVATPSLESAA